MKYSWFKELKITIKPRVLSLEFIFEKKWKNVTNDLSSSFPHMIFRSSECLIFSLFVWDGENFRYVEKQASEKQVALLTDERFLKVGMWMYLFQFYSFFLHEKRYAYNVYSVSL